MELTVPPVDVHKEVMADHVHGDRLVRMSTAVVYEGHQAATADDRGYSWQVTDHRCPECGDRIRYRLNLKDIRYTLELPTAD